MNRLVALSSFAIRRCIMVRPLRRLTPFERFYSSTAVERTGEETETLRARLLYQSKKRGILENDIIIGGFAQEALAGMSHEELLEYDSIINGDHMEWDLFYFMSGKKEPPKELQESAIFRRIQEYIKKKATAVN
uniref:Succinate dehydrogenase assembly factor 2, mitochondrial n=1 Tax=Ascaris lumbricoides TaxID=6252 RepID=A0A0M3IBY6_ASCLU